MLEEFRLSRPVRNGTRHPRHYGDFAALCADPEVDAIYLGTPHGTHFAYASEAIKAGKNVLSEKPLTMTADEARELQRLSLEHGVLVMEAMWMKFSPSIRKAQEAFVAAGAIGTPMIVQAGLGYPVPTNGPKRFWVPELGGGALYDMGVYTIALAQLFLGIPESVQGPVGHTRADGVDYFEHHADVRERRDRPADDIHHLLDSPSRLPRRHDRQHRLRRAAVLAARVPTHGGRPAPAARGTFEGGRRVRAHVPGRR